MKPHDILMKALETMTAREVAAALEVHETAVSQWKKNGRFPAGHALYLAERLGIPEPNLYDLIAAETAHEGRKEWLRKKAQGVPVCALIIASAFALIAGVSAQDSSLFQIDLSAAFHMLPTIYYAQSWIGWRWRRIAPASASLMEDERMGFRDRCVIAGFAFAIGMSVAGASMSLLWLIVLVARHERGLHLVSARHWIDSGLICARGFPVMGAASRPCREARPGA